MLDVLVSLMGEALKKIFSVSVDKVASKVSEKRSLAVALLELYDALVALEGSSRDALDLFQRYYDGGTPLRISARRVMESLVGTIEQFDTKLNTVYSKLGLYNPHLATVLREELYGKRHTIEVVNGLLAAAPHIKLDGKFPTDFIVVPTAPPDHSLFARRSARSRTETDLQVTKIRERLDNSLKKREINFSTREELPLILRNGELTLNRIEAARGELAEFIKENVRLSEILT